VPPPLHTLKIWGVGLYSARSYGAEFVFLFVRHATMLGTESCPRRCVYALNLGGTDISPRTKVPPGKRPPRTKALPEKNSPGPKVPPGQKTPGEKSPRAKDPPDKSTPDKNPPGPGHPTSGDLFYCSGSRQLNHSSLCCVETVLAFSSSVSDCCRLVVDMCW